MEREGKYFQPFCIFCWYLYELVVTSGPWVFAGRLREKKKCGGIARKNPVRYIATRTPFGFGNMTYFEEFPADSYKYFEGFPADAYYKYFEKFPADSCKSFAEFTADSP